MNEKLQKIERRHAEEDARVMFGKQSLTLNEGIIPWILDNIDSFVSQSRCNESIERVYLDAYAFHREDLDAWDKVGQAVGNLQALKVLSIDNGMYYDDDDEEDEDVPRVDWKVTARILSHIRQRITLIVVFRDLYISPWSVEDSRSFAQAIRGHPTITCFQGDDLVPYEALDALYSALATLPALESIRLSNRRLHRRHAEQHGNDRES
jgi:hypothetical protein